MEKLLPCVIMIRPLCQPLLEEILGRMLKQETIRPQQLPMCNIPPPLPATGRQGRKKEALRSDDWEQNSPGLIIHIIALIIINITCPFPLQNLFFLFFFFCNSIKLLFSQRDLLGQTSLLFLRTRQEEKQSCFGLLAERMHLTSRGLRNSFWHSCLCSAKRKGK